MTDTISVSETDTVMAVVPMFHANAWGLPYTCLMIGAKQVFPGQYLDPPNLLDLLVRERVTITAGVPTIWLGMLQILDENPGKYDLSSLRSIVTGGSAAPVSMIRAYQERHDLSILHSWGMTELCPVGTIGSLPNRLTAASSDEQYAFRARQGRPCPMVEIRGLQRKRPRPVGRPVDGRVGSSRAVDRQRLLQSARHAHVVHRGRLVSHRRHRGHRSVRLPPSARPAPKTSSRAAASGSARSRWKTRSWVIQQWPKQPSFRSLHPKWAERPLAIVVLKKDRTATPAELIEFLQPHFAKWWLPDAVEFAHEIPRTSAGKFLKTALREKYGDYYAKAGRGGVRGVDAQLHAEAE